MRQGISKDLGFTLADRSENLRRGAEVAKLMNTAGILCICAFAAPSEEIRQRAAEVVGQEKFLVVHVHAPLDVCRSRDKQGLYAKADAGEIANFIGVSAYYEVPDKPDLDLDTQQLSIEECVEQIVQLLGSRGFLA